MSIRAKMLRCRSVLTPKRRRLFAAAVLCCAIVASAGGCKSNCCGLDGNKNNETEKALRSDVERGQEKSDAQPPIAAPAELDEKTGSGSGSGASSVEETRPAFNPLNGEFGSERTFATNDEVRLPDGTGDSESTLYVGNAGATGEIAEPVERAAAKVPAADETPAADGAASERGEPTRRELPNKIGDYAASGSESAGRFVPASFRSAPTSAPVSSAATKPVGTGKAVDVAAEIARGTSNGAAPPASAPATSTVRPAESSALRRGTGKPIDVSAEIAAGRAR